MFFLSIFYFLIWIFWGVLLCGAFIYCLIVWNIKKTKTQYNIFPKVSLMAYAWQSGNIIERKIENFLGQNYPKAKFEVIIYDNDSSDETEKICKKYEKQGLIKYFRSPRPYDRKAPVLDQAIGKVAEGNIIALTDPDGVCESEWLKKIVQPFRDPEIGAVSGVTHCGNYYKRLFTKLRAIEDEWWYNICVLGKSGKLKISNFNPICGANYALRKEAWESVGRSHGKSLVEDYEMTFRLYGKGWRIASTDANLWQEEVENVGDYIRQRRRWYQSPLNDVFKGKDKLNKLLGSIPYSLQATGFLSLILFSVVCIYQTICRALMPQSLIFLSPFLVTYIALIYGLIKMGKNYLLPYALLFLTFDSALQMIVLIETKIRFKEERHWVKLGKGEYYHEGSEIIKS